jgi:hypothetical protein
MKIKLSPSEYKSLFILHRQIIEPFEPKDIIAKCYHELLLQVLDKMYKKGIRPRGYILTLTVPEACAFYLFWSTYKLPARLAFERSMLLQLCINIHQQLS